MNYKCALPEPVEGQKSVNLGVHLVIQEFLKEQILLLYLEKSGGALAPSAPPVPPPLLHKEAKE